MDTEVLFNDPSKYKIGQASQCPRTQGLPSYARHSRNATTKHRRKAGKALLAAGLLWGPECCLTEPRKVFKKTSDRAQSKDNRVSVGLGHPTVPLSLSFPICRLCFKTHIFRTRERVYLGLQIEGKWSIMVVIHDGGNTRLLATMHPQSGHRER